VDVHVEPAGTKVLAGRVDDALSLPRIDAVADGCEETVLDRDGGDAVGPAGGVDDMRSGDDEGVLYDALPGIRRLSTALATLYNIDWRTD
jgi:hypothetical protein